MGVVHHHLSGEDGVGEDRTSEVAADSHVEQHDEWLLGDPLVRCHVIPGHVVRPPVKPLRPWWAMTSRRQLAPSWGDGSQLS